MADLTENITTFEAETTDQSLPLSAGEDLNDTLSVEAEHNDDVVAEIPFNPNDISVNIVPRTIGQLIDMLEYDEIIIPSYQRMPNLWPDKKKSRFIESLMLNLPIPLFYFDEANDRNWRVIDGLQRITTLEHFILGDKKNTIGGNKEPLVLQDLEFKTEFNGKTWAQLPRDIQRRIMTNQVTVNLIGKSTPDEVKFNIFSRINQGGLVLTAQEIRTALFQGYKVDFLKTLVSPQTKAGQAFRAATSNSVHGTRQEDIDFATRFVSFYLLRADSYTPDMDTFLTRGTKAIPAGVDEQAVIVDKFTNAMQLALAVFGRHAFRKIAGEKRRPINKPLFELVSTYFADLNPEEMAKILNGKELFLERFIAMQNTPQFMRAISTATATRQSVITRHECFVSLIKDILEQA